MSKQKECNSEDKEPAKKKRREGIQGSSDESTCTKWYYNLNKLTDYDKLTRQVSQINCQVSPIKTFDK